MLLKIADWSQYPGPRGRSAGDHSAEEFFEQVLLPAWKQAISIPVLLTVDLDGTSGYAHSFLDEAFGRLAIDPTFDKDFFKVIGKESQDYQRVIESSMMEWQQLGVHENSPIKKKEILIVGGHPGKTAIAHLRSEQRGIVIVDDDNKEEIKRKLQEGEINGAEAFLPLNNHLLDDLESYKNYIPAKMRVPNSGLRLGSYNSKSKKRK